MSDEAAPESADDAKPAKPPKAAGGSKLGLLLTVVNLAATGFLVFKTVTAPHPVAAADGAHAAAEAKPAKPVAGPVAPMEAFVVNLRDEGVSRYLKTSFELELDNAETLAELEVAKRAVRDDVLRYLSNLSVNDTLGEEAKQTIQDGIVARLDRQLGAGKVKRLYFTDFVIQ